MKLDKEQVEKYRAFSFLSYWGKVLTFLTVAAPTILCCGAWWYHQPSGYFIACIFGLLSAWMAFNEIKDSFVSVPGNEKKPFLLCCDEYLKRTIIGRNAWYFNDGVPNGDIAERGAQLYPSADPTVMVLPLGGWWNRPRMYFRHGGNASIMPFRIRSYSLDEQSVAIDDRQGSVHVMGIYDAITTLNEYGVRQGKTSWRAIFEAMREEHKTLCGARDTLAIDLQKQRAQNAELDRDRRSLIYDRETQIATVEALLEWRKRQMLLLDRTNASLDKLISFIDTSSRLRGTKEGKWVLEFLLTTRIATIEANHALLTRYELMLEALQRKKAKSVRR